MVDKFNCKKVRDAKGVIGIRKSQTERKYNDKKIKAPKQTTVLKELHRKLTIPTNNKSWTHVLQTHKQFLPPPPLVSCVLLLL